MLGGKKVIKDYSACLAYAEQGWKWWGKTFKVQPVAMVGWDNRPCQSVEDGIYYINRSPSEFYDHLANAVKFVEEKNYPEKFIFIYAWNELAEGGYLVPTIGDPNAQYLKQINKVKNEFKIK